MRLQHCIGFHQPCAHVLRFGFVNTTSTAAITRVLVPVPALLLPSLIMLRLSRLPAFQKNRVLKTSVEIRYCLSIPQITVTTLGVTTLHAASSLLAYGAHSHPQSLFSRQNTAFRRGSLSPSSIRDQSNCFISTRAYSNNGGERKHRRCLVIV